MITTKTFKDIELMDSFIKATLKEFAPAGYDIKIIINIRQNHAQWLKEEVFYEVEVNRLDTCD